MGVDHELLVDSIVECNVCLPSNRAPPDKIDWKIMVSAHAAASLDDFGNNSRRLILDSGCSHHLTNNIELFGGHKLMDDGLFEINGWSGDGVSCSRYGNSIFGTMIYVPQSKHTLLCLEEMCTTWMLDRSSDNRTWTLTHPQSPDVKLVFKFVDHVLVCDVTNAMWSSVCNVNRLRVNACIGICKESYMDILEAIYLHSVACHPGDQQLKLSVSTDVLVGCPISVNAVENMSLLRDKCPNCEMGKAVRKRFGSRRSYSKVDKTREISSSVHPITQSYGPNGEILSVDLWFMDSVTFMITKGMLKRYTHIRLLKGRDKKSVFGGIRAILDDYKRNHLTVASVFNTQDESAVEILDLASDNEGAFIQAGLELLPKYSIDIQVVPSGDHIKMVERPLSNLM